MEKILLSHNEANFDLQAGSQDLANGVGMSTEADTLPECFHSVEYLGKRPEHSHGDAF